MALNAGRALRFAQAAAGALVIDRGAAKAGDPAPARSAIAGPRGVAPRQALGGMWTQPWPVLQMPGP
jgi:hypothetical protein